MLAIIGHRIGTSRIDDHRGVVALLLLQAGVTVKPVRAGLFHGEFVREGLARADARKADAGHAIHLERHQEPVPMNRRVFFECVSDMQANSLAFLEPDSRTRNGSVNGDCMPCRAINRDLAMGNRQVDV